MDDISHLDETKELKVIYLSQPIRRKILSYHNHRFLKFLRSIFKAYLRLPEISGFFAWEAKIMTYVLISRRNTNAYLGNCHSCLYFRIPLKLWKDEGQLATLINLSFGPAPFSLILPLKATLTVEKKITLLKPYRSQLHTQMRFNGPSNRGNELEKFVSSNSRQVDHENAQFNVEEATEGLFSFDHSDEHQGVSICSLKKKRLKQTRRKRRRGIS